MIVVYGGTSSGKSSIAEDITSTLGLKLNKELIYLATMESQSQAAKERILHHKTMREGKGFVTIEEMYDLDKLADDFIGKVVLVECMSNLVANILFNEAGTTPPDDEIINKTVEKIINDLSVLDKGAELVVVTNNVFGGRLIEDDWSRAYLKCLGRLNVRLAEYADTFVEVSMGLVNILKGEKIWL